MIELVLVGEGEHLDNSHPMHLHGYRFHVLAHDKLLAESTTVEEVMRLDRAGMDKQNDIGEIHGLGSSSSN